LEYDNSNRILMTGSLNAGDFKGLDRGRAYTVLGVKKLSNGVRLVKLRDPKGTEKY